MLNTNFEKPAGVPSRSIYWILATFTAIYALFFFPRAFFRHDDWWILGNGVFRVANDWLFAFKPTLYSFNQEETWFFRPFFKIAALLYYRAFGLNYQAWLLTTLCTLLGAVWYGYKTLLRITCSHSQALTFVVLFFCSIHFHFGSTVWIGEGLMNCPQLFLLFLSTYCFVISLRDPYFWKSKYYYLSLLYFFLSLGFKEAGIIHTSFFFAIASHSKNLRNAFASLFPLAILSAIYLAARFLIVPLNESYAPHLYGPHLLSSLEILTAAMALPSLAFLVFKLFHKTAVSSSWSHYTFFIPTLLSLLPYLGHPFFSPGWLITPGMYLAFALALYSPKEIKTKTYLIPLSLCLLLLSAIPVACKLNSISWWQWHIPQKKLNEIFKQYAADKSIDEIYILRCQNLQYPDVIFERVVGSPEGLAHNWALHANRHVPIQTRWCNDPIANEKRPNRLILRWQFPNLEVL